MTCVRSITFTIPGASGSPGVQVYAEEQNGSLVFTLSVLGTGSLTADLRGLFFDVTDPAKLAGLAFSGDGGKITELDTVDVIDLGNGANMEGAAQPFDVGLEFGSQGIGKDDIQGLSFTLSNAASNLTLDDIANTQFGARLTSVGAPGGLRDGSAKLTTTAPAAPDAKDDSYQIFEDGQDGLNDPSTTPEGKLFQVLANDTDADGDTLTITHVEGALHGSVQIVDGADADNLIGDAILYTPHEDYAGTDSFTYCITDNNGGTDFADVAVAIEAVADVPTLSVQTAAGSAANKILVTVTATETDADSSEYMDRIELSGIPAGVTVTPLGVNPAGEPNQIVQVFELTLPTDQDTDFHLGITAVAKETLNDDEEVATGSVHVLLNHTLTQAEATFYATGQSIWATGNQFTFTDDRFLGIDTSWDEEGGGFLYGATDGHLKAGFQSKLTFEGGEIDAQVVYDLEVETLYNKTTDVLFLTADALFDAAGSSFTTEGPEGTYVLDFLFDFLLNASAGVDFGVDSYDILDVTIGPYSTQQNIIDYDSNDGTALTIGLPAGFSLTFAWPHLDTTSEPSSTTVILSDGQSNNFFELGLDVDDLVFELLKIQNPFNIGFDIGVAEGSVELADLDLSFGMNFLQDFAMAAGALEGRIIFEDGYSEDFNFDDDVMLTGASSRDANHDGSVDYTLELAPSVTLSNDTDLGFNFGVQFDVLKLSGSYDIGVDSGSLSLGPLFDVGTTVPLGTVDVYDNTFDLAFGSQDLVFAA